MPTISFENGDDANGYTENGFTFNSSQAPGNTGTGEFFATYDGPNNTRNHAIVENGDGDSALHFTRMTAVDGSNFSISSIDVDNLNDPTDGPPVVATFIGYHTDGTTVRQTFTLDQQQGLQTVNLIGFTNISAFDFNSGSDAPYVAYDNVVATPVCFVTGTLILTASGEVAVEALQVGDLAVTASGGLRPITWIGHRALEAAGKPLPHDQQPVRIRVGAFGHDASGRSVPVRDLRLSPGHPVLVGADADGEGGHLVPVMCLINGTTITREAVTSVTYWHVELDAHDILLAEGLPAESYYDMGSRVWFAGRDGALIDIDFVPAGAHGRCRPVAVEGAVVEAEHRRLDGVFAAYLAAQCAWREPAVA